MQTRAWHGLVRAPADAVKSYDGPPKLARPISAPLPIGCADNRDYTERKKGRAKNMSIPRPSRDCAEQRQEAEQSKVERLGVHSCPPIRKGQRRSCPSLAR